MLGRADAACGARMRRAGEAYVDCIKLWCGNFMPAEIKRRIGIKQKLVITIIMAYLRRLSSSLSAA